MIFDGLPMENHANALNHYVLHFGTINKLKIMITLMFCSVSARPRLRKSEIVRQTVAGPFENVAHLKNNPIFQFSLLPELAETLCFHVIL